MLRFEQHDQATSADAADADNLVRDVDKAILAQDCGAMWLERGQVTGEESPQLFAFAANDIIVTGDQGRMFHNPSLSIDNSGQLVERAETVLPGGFRCRCSRAFAALLAHRCGECVDFEAQVVQLERAEPSRAGHGFSIPAHRGAGCRSRFFVRQFVVACCNHDAGSQTFEIPFEWPRGRLIEVIHVEHQPAIRSVEQPEVRQVGVPTQLHLQIG